MWYISALKEMSGAKGTPGTLEGEPIFGNLFSGKSLPKQTNRLHFDVSSLPIGPIPSRSPLMGSKLHVSSFSKPNQCCPFLHSLVPLAVKLPDIAFQKRQPESWQSRCLMEPCGHFLKEKKMKMLCSLVHLVFG